MSIIERSNPLNLQYRVCIVTSASTPLGVIICKTLLKANALVLGVDNKPKDKSLNAGLGTHFQFESCDLEEEDVSERIIEAARKKFGGVERIDGLVNIIEEEDDLEGLRRLSDAVGEVMDKERKGSIVNVLGGSDGVEERTAVGWLAAGWLRPCAWSMLSLVRLTSRRSLRLTTSRTV